MAHITSVSYVITISKIIKNDSSEELSVDEFESNIEVVAQELVGAGLIVEVVKS